MKRFSLPIALILGLASCDTQPLEPLPLDITIEASRVTAAVGDTINFLTVAQGGALVGVIIEYGDGAEDQFGTSGARTASVTFRHVFTDPGVFAVTATVVDGSLGEKSAAIDVTISP